MFKIGIFDVHHRFYGTLKLRFYTLNDHFIRFSLGIFGFRLNGQFFQILIT